MSMMTHLATIVWFLRQVPDVVIGPVTRIGGGLGYVFIVLMALTSNDRAVRALGQRNWNRLHAIGLTYVWAVFTFTFVGRVARSVNFAPWAVLCLALMAFRLWGKRRPARPAETANA